MPVLASAILRVAVVNYWEPASACKLVEANSDSFPDASKARAGHSGSRAIRMMSKPQSASLK